MAGTDAGTWAVTAAPTSPIKSGRTLGNTTLGGSLRRNGGSYGGLGAFGSAEQFANAVYGEYRDPNEPGSGGGTDADPTGNGRQ